MVLGQTSNIMAIHADGHVSAASLNLGGSRIHPYTTACPSARAREVETPRHKMSKELHVSSISAFVDAFSSSLSTSFSAC
jgi:hypothetical protein